MSRFSGKRISIIGPVLQNAIFACVFVLNGIVLSGCGGASLLAQDTESAKLSRQSVSVGTYGVSRYRPGRWGTIGVDAINRSSEPTSMEAAAWIGGQKTDQFGRSVWLPAETDCRDNFADSVS